MRNILLRCLYNVSVLRPCMSTSWQQNWQDNLHIPFLASFLYPFIKLGGFPPSNSSRRDFVREDRVRKKARSKVTFKRPERNKNANKKFSLKVCGFQMVTDFPKLCCQKIGQKTGRYAQILDLSYLQPQPIRSFNTYKTL